MLRMSKNKNEESEKLRVSINEINAQLEKCQQIEDIHVDVAKYDQILDNLKRNLEAKSLGDTSDESVDLVKMKEMLSEKEEILNQAMQEIECFEAEYKEFIEQQKKSLQDPDVELSRIKVKVKQKREKINNLVISQMTEQIVEVIYDAENMLRNAQVQRENGISQDFKSELPKDEIERTKKLVEVDEKELYAVRKSIHTYKEILSFMEFRFSEMERMMSKGGNKDVKAEWMELQEKKKSCEEYINKKQSMIRSYVERLFEVRQELQEIENPVESEEKNISAPEEELQAAIDGVKEKVDTFQEKVNQFLQMKELWNQEFIAMEMTLEELWRNL